MRQLCVLYARHHDHHVSTINPNRQDQPRAQPATTITTINYDQLRSTVVVVDSQSDFTTQHTMRLLCASYERPPYLRCRMSAKQKHVLTVMVLCICHMFFLPEPTPNRISRIDFEAKNNDAQNFNTYGVEFHFSMRGAGARARTT